METKNISIMETKMETKEIIEMLDKRIKEKEQIIREMNRDVTELKFLKDRIEGKPQDRMCSGTSTYTDKSLFEFR